MRFLHLVDRILKGRGVNSLGKFYESDVTVVAEPVVKAPGTHRLNGQDGIRMDGAVLRKVFVNAADRQFQFRHLLVGDLFADSLVDSAKFLGQGLRDSDLEIPSLQRVFGIACEEWSVEYLEEAGVGDDVPGFHLASFLINDEILIVKYARESCCLKHTWNLGLESRSHSPADLPEILVFALASYTRADLVDSVNILIGIVIRQFEAHFRN